ncbi:Trafficking protein particle complex subunit 33 [Candida viswanathii]|uniref:Trafficking protein particle complex subunit 33 n=1 Tax=Candida viswanathii TaxID=5486 RepID=A0A367YHY8_9ASCO|nr:Trafficking protein particle complex subunit 33 [Candida viswanathii]
MSEDTLDKQTYVNSSSLQYLLQELVPTSIRVSHKLLDPTVSTFDEESEQTRIDQQLSAIKEDLPGTVNVLDSDLVDSDEVSIRVETYGYNLGLKIAEVLLYKSSGSKVVDILDIMKFVCRDVWRCLYNKQMDNLRTNHRGTFVLVDNSYKLIAQLNSSKGMQDTLAKAKVYLWFPCGVIRGILMSFGIEPTSPQRLPSSLPRNPKASHLRREPQYIFKLARTDESNKVNANDEAIIKTILAESQRGSVDESPFLKAATTTTRIEISSSLNTNGRRRADPT